MIRLMTLIISVSDDTSEDRMDEIDIEIERRLNEIECEFEEEELSIEGVE